MADAKRDENRIPTLLGVSSVDGVTPVPIYADPTTHRLYVDDTGSSGDVAGPATNTDGYIPQWDGTDSKTLKNGLALGIADDNIVQIDMIGVADNDYAKFTANGLEGRSYTEVKQDLAIEGTEIKSTGEAGGTKFLREDGDGTCSWQTVAASTDEKVKYDAGDPTAGYVADKIVAGTGISVAEGSGATENKLVVTSTITQATRDSLGLDTDDSPQFAGIELGHASDTTLSRVSAGRIAVEGVNVPTISSTDTFTNKTIDANGTGNSITNLEVADFASGVIDTDLSSVSGSDDTIPSAKATKTALDSKAPTASPTLTGTITLADNARIDLTLPTADTYCTGPVTASFNSGYSSAVGDLVFFGSGGKWLEVDADAVATCKGMMGIALESKTDGQAMLVALPGSFVRLDSWNWTVGDTLYAGETLGAIQNTIPTGADAIIRVIGFAVSADVIFFNPSPDQQSTVA